ncbi:phosphotransferase family protein [Frondihabitans australicus]|uniref:Aminoglycoside phosphotransferase (APT) family kinase protein n=1 Tax=Frondihabitans australicus TaxID=386892 RepID=A0A495IEG4_9MICO|nr:phosphotransferase family protein [Frondihabitans australicus]RKR74372.1 aminoglycoside phosphotransferase (APT) family kinase protein [Frondihabitans australicus]
MSDAPAGYAPSAAEVERLEAFLAERDLAGPSITLTPIGDGHANLTYLATSSGGSDDTRRVVVRRPPPPPLPPGANDVLREAGVMAAVGAAGGVPVPAVLATAEAGEVFDVPFFLMSFVEGPVVTSSAPADLTVDDRRELSFALADTLAALHSIDWRETGLHGRPEGSNQRQRSRLARLVATPAGEPPPEFADVEAWLTSNAPVESGAAIVHGDFRIGNLLLDPAFPRIAAVLDWELATVADPLVDLGYLLASWAPPGAASLTPIQELGSATSSPGFASPSTLAEHYFAARGLPEVDVSWYVALANWKLAVLYEYSRRRFDAGVGDPYYAGPEKVSALLRAARRAAGLA